MTAFHNRKEWNSICDAPTLMIFTLMLREQKEFTFNIIFLGTGVGLVVWKRIHCCKIKVKVGSLHWSSLPFIANGVASGWYIDLTAHIREFDSLVFKTCEIDFHATYTDGAVLVWMHDMWIIKLRLKHAFEWTADFWLLFFFDFIDLVDVFTVTHPKKQDAK